MNKDDIADLIQEEVSWFNGWSVNDDEERESCEKAAYKIIEYMKDNRNMTYAKVKSKS